jgi:pSer/pThr/pTyr-binding forkhead associated (FHA) protein
MTAQATRACPKCGAQTPAEFRFCGSCGGRMDEAAAASAPPAQSGKTMYFGAQREAGNAKLILIKGEGIDGISYPLSSPEQILGRVEGSILFAEDPLLSPRHANFLYRNGSLVVQDLGSANGVFARIRQPVTLESGAVFLVGEQLLQIEACPPDLGPQTDADGTVFYASPKRPARLQLLQRLRGGDIGMVFRSREGSLTIGREGNDVNFPDDPFISGHHTKVTVADGGRFLLVDNGSKNGTFLRIAGEAVLSHSDHVFVGQQLLRVEMA